METHKKKAAKTKLREHAEKKIGLRATYTAKDIKNLSHETVANLIHELQVHQIELKMQNHELLRIHDKLEYTRDKYSHLYDFAPTGYFTMIENGLIDEINLTLTSLLGVVKIDLIGKLFSLFIYEEDQDIFYKHRLQLLKTKTPQSCELRLLTKDTQQIYVRLESVIVPDEKNQKQIRVAVSNITKQKHSEEQIALSLKEKEILLRELYHRTKNNMQVICSLLSLESMQITDEETLTIFEDIENRIRVMALVHQKLCQANDLSKIDFKDYIQDIGDHLLTGYQGAGRISFQVDGDSIPILIDCAIPCGLILNELISNSLRHAFPDGKDGEILISVYELDNEIELTFSDNGIGLPKGYNLKECKSFGLGIVRDIIKSQLYGKAELKEAQGMAFQIRFDQSLHKIRVKDNCKR